MVWCTNAYKFLRCFLVMGLGGGTGVGKEEGLRAGFKDGALEAEYVASDFSFKTSIPLVGRTREGALCDLAEKIVEHGIPYADCQEVLVPSLGHEVLSGSDRDHLFECAYCFYHSSKE